MRVICIGDDTSCSAWKQYCLYIKCHYPHWSKWIKDYLQHYFDMMGMPLFKERCSLLMESVPRTQLDRIRFLAQTMDIEEEYLFYVNLLSDIARPTGCSSVMHVNNRGEVLIGHHLDWPDYGISHKLTTFTKLGSKKFVITQGFAGLLSSAVSINSHGVAVFLHDSYTKREYSAVGKSSIGLSLSELIEDVDTAQSFVDKMTERRFAYGCMYFVVDPNQGFLVEHAIDQIVVQEIHKGETICRTNHFLSNGINNSYEESEKRYEKLIASSEMLRKREVVNVSDIYEVLSPKGIFRPLDSSNAQQLSSCSIHSMAYNATQGTMLASSISQFPTLEINKPSKHFIDLSAFNTTDSKSVSQ